MKRWRLGDELGREEIENKMRHKIISVGVTVTFDSFPREVKLCIFICLDTRVFIRLSQVSKSFCELVDSLKPTWAVKESEIREIMGDHFIGSEEW